MRSSSRSPGDSPAADARPGFIVARWLLAVAIVVAATDVVGGLAAAVAAEDGPTRDRGPESGDAAHRLDRVIEKLDRLVDRLAAERMGPPGPPPPPHHGPSGPQPDGFRGHREHDEHRSTPGRGPHREPGVPGPRPGPTPGPGMRGEGRPGRPGPWGDMPADVQDMMQRRMQEGRRRMEEAQEKVRQLEERIRKLEAEVERLKTA